MKITCTWLMKMKYKIIILFYSWEYHFIIYTIRKIDISFLKKYHIKMYFDNESSKNLFNTFITI